MELNESDRRITGALDRARANLNEQIDAIRNLTSETEQKLRQALMAARGKLLRAGPGHRGDDRRTDDPRHRHRHRQR